MPGDCLRAILFIFYLACALADHSYNNSSIQAPQECKNNTPLTVQLKYTDDITYNSTSYKMISQSKYSIRKTNKLQPQSEQNPDRRI